MHIHLVRFILAWVSGLIWSEVKQLWDVGLEEYVNDMWNVIDFVTNSLYVATVALRVVAYYRVQKENEALMVDASSNQYRQREEWDAWDPMLISEGLFSAANIFRFSLISLFFKVNLFTAFFFNFLFKFQFVKASLHFLSESSPWTTASISFQDGNGYHEILLPLCTRSLRLFLR